MRGVSYIIWKRLLMLGLLAMATGASADLIDTRVDLGSETLKQPAAVKRLYREAWNIDNKTDLTAVDQLEYFYQNNPGFDADTLALMAQGTDLLKKMNFGTQGADPAANARTIKAVPLLSIIALSHMADGEATPTDILSNAETMEAAEHLRDKAFKKQNPAEKYLPIDIEQF